MASYGSSSRFSSSGHSQRSATENQFPGMGLPFFPTALPGHKIRSAWFKYIALSARATRAAPPSLRLPNVSKGRFWIEDSVATSRPLIFPNVEMLPMQNSVAPERALADRRSRTFGANDLLINRPPSPSATERHAPPKITSQHLAAIPPKNFQHLFLRDSQQSN